MHLIVCHAFSCGNKSSSPPTWYFIQSMFHLRNPRQCFTKLTTYKWSTSLSYAANVLEVQSPVRLLVDSIQSQTVAAICTPQHIDLLYILYTHSICTHNIHLKMYTQHMHPQHAPTASTTDVPKAYYDSLITYTHSITVR